MTDRIGFIGLGDMGGAIAERLLKEGHELQVHDAVRRTMEKLVSLGAQPADSSKDLARRCTIIFMCLPNSKIVEAVVLGSDGVLEGAQEGSVVIDMTSANPLSTRFLCELLGAKGIEMLDAPVSGGPTGCRVGTLAVMVGGKEEVFERCRPILSAIAPQSLSYVGPIGWGHTIKAINNFMNAAQRWITTEAVALAVKGGVPLQKAVEVLRVGAARNYTLDSTFPNYILPNKGQGFTGALMRKDLGITTDMALKLGVPMPMANHIKDLFELFVWLDGSNKEVNQYLRYIEEWAGISMRT